MIACAFVFEPQNRCCRAKWQNCIGRQRSQKPDGENDLRKDDGNDRDKLDKDIDRRPGGVLEGIAYGIADDGGLMGGASFSAEVVVLDVFFRVIPGSAAVAHEDGEQKSRDGRTEQKAHNSVCTEKETGDKRGEHGDDGG